MLICVLNYVLMYCLPQLLFNVTFQFLGEKCLVLTLYDDIALNIIISCYHGVTFTIV